MTLKLETILRDVGKTTFQKWKKEARSLYNPSYEMEFHEFEVQFIKRQHAVYMERVRFNAKEVC